MHFLASLLYPKVAYADLDSFIANVDSMIVNPLIEFLFAIAVVYFLWGVFQFMMNQENEEKKTTGKSHMLWGVIGIVIMLGVWGILNLVLDTLGISDQVKIETQDNAGTLNVDLKDYNPNN